VFKLISNPETIKEETGLKCVSDLFLPKLTLDAFTFKFFGSRDYHSSYIYYPLHWFQSLPTLRLISSLTVPNSFVSSSSVL